MTFKSLTDRSGFFESSVCIGALRLDHGFMLIDTGVEDSAVKKALQGIPQDWGTLKAVLNTHAHADHIGGNAWCARNHGAVLYGPAGEAHYIEHPDLEPHFLFGCAPIAELKNKFYCAKASTLQHRVTPGSLELGGRHLTLLDLKGHSPAMLGVQTEEGLVYLADGLMPETLVAKHKLMFVHDLAQHLETLERIQRMDAGGYVLSHGGYLSEIRDLVTLNREALLEVNGLIAALTQNGAQDTEIHAELYQRLAMNETPAQYYLNHTVVRAHLKYLKDLGKVRLEWNEGRLIWSSV